MALINDFKYYSRKVWKKIFPDPSKDQLIAGYIAAGRVPWSKGYIDYKMDFIKRAISDKGVIEKFISGILPAGFAVGIDERAIEYPWLFSNLSNAKKRFLDAGSTFNYPEIIHHETLRDKELSITTYYPERNNYNQKRISYVYADLRDLPFRNDWFDEIVCQSTLEHIDMDNSIYGYDLESKVSGHQKSYEYLRVIGELYRILHENGLLLLTFPFGKFENHGFFQQFDIEMVGRIKQFLEPRGEISMTFFKYLSTGWVISSEEECNDAVSFNPHTGLGKGNDGAAHSRAICAFKFIKRG